MSLTVPLTASSPILPPGKKGALARDHRGAERAARRALFPKRRALVGLDQPLQHLAAVAERRLCGADIGHREARLGVEVAVRVAQPPAALRDRPDAAPAAVGHLEHVREHLLGWGVALRAHSPRVGVLQLGAALLELRHRAADALQHVEWLEAGDDDRDAIFLDQRAILPGAHHATDMTGGQKGLDAIGRRPHQRGDRRRHQHVRDQHREVGQPELAGLEDRHRIGRRGRLEPDAEEDHLAAGVLPGYLNGVERRVDDSHIAALALDPEQVLAAAGDAQHVAERAEDHAGAGGDRQGLVDHLERGDAHRAAGAMDQLDLGRQQLVDPVADDRVRLPTADLHDRPGPRGDPADLVEQARGQIRVAVLVQVLHATPPRWR